MCNRCGAKATVVQCTTPAVTQNPKTRSPIPALIQLLRRSWIIYPRFPSLSLSVIIDSSLSPPHTKPSRGQLDSGRLSVLPNPGSERIVSRETTMIDLDQRELLEHRSQRANDSAFAMSEVETITMERVPGTRGNECGLVALMRQQSKAGKEGTDIRCEDDPLET